MYFFVHFFFFFFLKRGRKVVGTRQQLMPVSEKNCFCFLVEYNGNNEKKSVSEKRKKRQKNEKKNEKKMKKIYKYIFFS